MKIKGSIKRILSIVLTAVTLFVMCTPVFSVAAKAQKGDINSDGKINMFDYMKVKAHYFGTSLLTEEELILADINGDEKVNMFDYMKIKAHHFGSSLIPEEQDKYGDITYNGTYQGTIAYDESKGNYSLSLDLDTSESIGFVYCDERLNWADITITGDVADTSALANGEKLFKSSETTLAYNGARERHFAFTFNPDTKTLNVVSSISVDPDAPISLPVAKFNKDAGADAIAVWTEAGTKIREVTDASTGEIAWAGNEWRYFIIVDAEGRIAYAVLHPDMGYGDPDGVGYYCNSYYSDYTKNPAIKLLDGYKNDWSEGGICYKLYELVVPEGGFAITSHGATNNQLADMISLGTVSDYDLSKLNSRSAYDDETRLSYDMDKQIVSLDTVDVENGLFVTMSYDESLKIAQFADLHFGEEGRVYQNDKIARTKAYMQQLVAEQKPDLIVCSGDNIMTTGVDKLAEFADFMDSLKTPWTFIFGNHDAESSSAGFCKKDLSDYLESCDSPYLLYDAGYIEEANNRYGNFSISVLNYNQTELIGAIILFDAGGYSSALSSYDAITTGQIEWYKSEIDKLNKGFDGSMIPSMVFSHIQLPEFHTAYVSALNGTGAEFIIEQPLSDDDIAGIGKNGPTYTNTGLYDVLVQKGSTKAYFVGHAHTLNFQVKMDGIVLGFGPQTGFSTKFENNDLLRRSYVYNFGRTFDFTTTVAVESGENIGLTYNGTYDSAGVYNSANGTYTIDLDFNSAHYIQLGYKGLRLNLNELTVTGDVADTEALAEGVKLFKSNNVTLMYKGSKARHFNFVFDPSAMTLHVTVSDIPADPNAPKSLTASKLNADAGADAIAIWTESGTKIRTVVNATTGEISWVGNEWRYFIIVDAQGRIAYAVVHPERGYGGPIGTGYYCNPDYSDYTNNPAIKLLDGYKSDYGTGIGYKLFEIVIPEGGFAITSHGTTNNDIVDMLSRGRVDNYDISNINTRSVYDSDVRLSYDATTKTISIN